MTSNLAFSGQRGSQQPGLSEGESVQVSAIAAGGVHSLAITEDAEVVSTGVNDEGALGRRTGMATHLSSTSTFVLIGQYKVLLRRV